MTMTEIEAYCDKMAREYIKAFDPKDVCTNISYYAYFQGMEDAIMNLDKISQDKALLFTSSPPLYNANKQSQFIDKINKK